MFFSINLKGQIKCIWSVLTGIHNDLRFAQQITIVPDSLDEMLNFGSCCVRRHIITVETRHFWQIPSYLDLIVNSANVPALFQVMLQPPQHFKQSPWLKTAYWKCPVDAVHKRHRRQQMMFEGSEGSFHLIWNEDSFNIFSAASEF